jgi:hypothetical protein
VAFFHLGLLNLVGEGIGALANLALSGEDGAREYAAELDRREAAAREHREALPARPTWDVVLADLDKTPDLRPDSVRGYRTAVNALRKVLPGVASPADLTPEMAHRFKREVLSGTYARARRATRPATTGPPPPARPTSAPSARSGRSTSSPSGTSGTTPGWTFPTRTPPGEARPGPV